MSVFLTYLWVFLIGGAICMIGEILIITTKITSSRILVSFVLAGVVLEAFGLFAPIQSVAKAGISVPIVGFGAALARGAIGAVKSTGILGAFTGGLQATAGGIAAAVGFAFLFGLIFKARSK